VEILLGLMFWVAVGAGVKTAWDHARADRHAARQANVTKAAKKASPKDLTPAQRRVTAARSDVGWWASETLRGFPVHRTGWHNGWLEHKTELVKRRDERERARTAHAETQADVAETLRGHRERQRAARQRYDRAQAPPQEQAPSGVPPLPADTVAGAPAPGLPPIQEPAWAAPPAASTPGPAQSSTKAVNGTASATAPVEGKPVATEGTYTQSIQLAEKVEADAEAHLAEKPWQEMENHVDAISALMRGDTATLGDYAEVADALKDVQRAWEKAVEAAQTARANLQQRHGGIKQASDDAPVPMAKPEFYEGD
jgi:hypothetical protein